MWLALQKNGDVFTGDLETGGLLEGNRIGLMRSLFEHGGETKKLAVSRLVDDDFLMIFIDGRNANPARDHHIGLTTRITDFVDALPRRKSPQFDLTRENSSLLIIKKRKEWNVLQ